METIMNTSFTARHFTASPDLQENALESVQKLTKFYDAILDCDIVAEPHPDPVNSQQIELNVKVAKDLLTAKENAPSYEQAINAAVDNMKRQLKKYKSKRFAHQ